MSKARRGYLSDAELERRLWRHYELEHAYWHLEAQLDRPPTARELWAESPPPDSVLGNDDEITIKVHVL